MWNKRTLPVLLLAASVGLFSTSCNKKEGCTDPAALNYNPDAEKDNGSCEYPEKPTDNSTIYTTMVVGSDTIVTVDDRGRGTGTMTWTKNRIWVLDGFVFVNSGQELTIEAGTVIKGKSGQGENASALIVARGAKIFANGTAAEPIIMTAESDQLNGNIPVMASGLWGGLIVLGKSRLNSTPGETAIEGIPTSEPRGLYGGNDDNDNSGVIRYLSLRHGGTDIGAGNEINGITLGGVGSGTVIEYVEVISNVDDGIEFFGGTARVKYAVVAFCGDDSYDYDEGYRGFGQFWLAVQNPGNGDRGGEHDGGTVPQDGTPYSHPLIYNATYIGSGIADGHRALTLRENAGGEYHNSIFANWGRGVDIEKRASGEDTYNRLLTGDLKLEGNVFFDVRIAGVAATAADLFTINFVAGAADAGESANFAALFATAGNSIADPGITYTLSTSGGFNPVPTNALSAGTAPSDAWFTPVTFKGAFDPAASTNWAHGWTLLHQSGYLD